jgi:hypothetical protein
MQKETEKNLKYKYLSVEIRRLWNMKCFLISAITGATEIVSSGQKISAKPGKAFNRFSTKGSHTRNITHNKRSATIVNLKLECCGSPSVQDV